MDLDAHGDTCWQGGADLEEVWSVFVNLCKSDWDKVHILQGGHFEAPTLRGDDAWIREQSLNVQSTIELLEQVFRQELLTALPVPRGMKKTSRGGDQRFRLPEFLLWKVKQMSIGKSRAHVTDFRRQHLEKTGMKPGGTNFSWPGDLTSCQSNRETSASILVACLSMMRRIASGNVTLPLNVDLDASMDERQLYETIVFRGKHLGSLGWQMHHAVIKGTQLSQDEYPEIHARCQQAMTGQAGLSPLLLTEDQMLRQIPAESVVVVVQDDNGANGASSPQKIVWKLQSPPSTLTLRELSAVGEGEQGVGAWVWEKVAVETPYTEKQLLSAEKWPQLYQHLSRAETESLSLTLHQLSRDLQELPQDAVVSVVIPPPLGTISASGHAQGMATWAPIGGSISFSPLPDTANRFLNESPPEQCSHQAYEDWCWGCLYGKKLEEINTYVWDPSGQPPSVDCFEQTCCLTFYKQEHRPSSGDQVRDDYLLKLLTSQTLDQNETMPQQVLGLLQFHMIRRNLKGDAKIKKGDWLYLPGRSVWVSTKLETRTSMIARGPVHPLQAVLQAHIEGEEVARSTGVNGTVVLSSQHLSQMPTWGDVDEVQTTDNKGQLLSWQPTNKHHVWLVADDTLQSLCLDLKPCLFGSWMEARFCSYREQLQQLSAQHEQTESGGIGCCVSPGCCVAPRCDSKASQKFQSESSSPKHWISYHLCRHQCQQWVALFQILCQSDIGHDWTRSLLRTPLMHQHAQSSQHAVLVPAASGSKRSLAAPSKTATDYVAAFKKTKTLSDGTNCRSQEPPSQALSPEDQERKLRGFMLFRPWGSLLAPTGPQQPFCSLHGLGFEKEDVETMWTQCCGAQSFMGCQILDMFVARLLQDQSNLVTCTNGMKILFCPAQVTVQIVQWHDNATLKMHERGLMHDKSLWKTPHMTQVRIYDILNEQEGWCIYLPVGTGTHFYILSVWQESQNADISMCTVDSHRTHTPDAAKDEVARTVLGWVKMHQQWSHDNQTCDYSMTLWVRSESDCQHIKPAPERGLATAAHHCPAQRENECAAIVSRMVCWHIFHRQFPLPAAVMDRVRKCLQQDAGVDRGQARDMVRTIMLETYERLISQHLRPFTVPIHARCPSSMSDVHNTQQPSPRQYLLRAFSPGQVGQECSFFLTNTSDFLQAPGRGILIMTCPGFLTINCQGAQKLPDNIKSATARVALVLCQHENSQQPAVVVYADQKDQHVDTFEFRNQGAQFFPRDYFTPQFTVYAQREHIKATVQASTFEVLCWEQYMSVLNKCGTLVETTETRKSKRVPGRVIEWHLCADPGAFKRDYPNASQFDAKGDVLSQLCKQFEGGNACPVKWTPSAHDSKGLYSQTTWWVDMPGDAGAGVLVYTTSDEVLQAIRCPCTRLQKPPTTVSGTPLQNEQDRLRPLTTVSCLMPALPARGKRRTPDDEAATALQQLELINPPDSGCGFVHCIALGLFRAFDKKVQEILVRTSSPKGMNAELLVLLAQNAFVAVIRLMFARFLVQTDCLYRFLDESEEQPLVSRLTGVNRQTPVHNLYRLVAKSFDMDPADKQSCYFTPSMIRHFVKFMSEWLQMSVVVIVLESGADALPMSKAQSKTPKNCSVGWAAVARHRTDSSPNTGEEYQYLVLHKDTSAQNRERYRLQLQWAPRGSVWESYGLVDKDHLPPWLQEQFDFDTASGTIVAAHENGKICVEDLSSLCTTVATSQHVCNVFVETLARQGFCRHNCLLPDIGEKMPLGTADIILDADRTLSNLMAMPSFTWLSAFFTCVGLNFSSSSVQQGAPGEGIIDPRLGLADKLLQRIGQCLKSVLHHTHKWLLETDISEGLSQLVLENFQRLRDLWQDRAALSVLYCHLQDSIAPFRDDTIPIQLEKMSIRWETVNTRSGTEIMDTELADKLRTHKHFNSREWSKLGKLVKLDSFIQIDGELWKPVVTLQRKDFESLLLLLPNTPLPGSVDINWSDERKKTCWDWLVGKNEPSVTHISLQKMRKRAQHPLGNSGLPGFDFLLRAHCETSAKASSVTPLERINHIFAGEDSDNPPLPRNLWVLFMSHILHSPILVFKDTSRDWDPFAQGTDNTRVPTDLVFTWSCFSDTSTENGWEPNGEYAQHASTAVLNWLESSPSNVNTLCEPTGAMLLRVVMGNFWPPDTSMQESISPTHPDEPVGQFPYRTVAPSWFSLARVLEPEIEKLKEMHKTVSDWRDDITRLLYGGTCSRQEHQRPLVFSSSEMDTKGLCAIPHLPTIERWREACKQEQGACSDKWNFFLIQCNALREFLTSVDEQVALPSYSMQHLEGENMKRGLLQQFLCVPYLEAQDMVTLQDAADTKRESWCAIPMRHVRLHSDDEKTLSQRLTILERSFALHTCDGCAPLQRPTIWPSRVQILEQLVDEPDQRTTQHASVDGLQLLCEAAHKDERRVQEQHKEVANEQGNLRILDSGVEFPAKELVQVDNSRN